MTGPIQAQSEGADLAGRYRLRSRIGGGGMAEVYDAWDLDLERAVAVKIPLPYLANDPSFGTRLRAEAAVMAALDHPGIVRLYDYGEDSDRPFIAMELVSGPSLRAVLESEGALSPARALRITDGLLSALQYAHDRGVLHRDIKPGNVLLTEDDRPKLADFGIALAGASAGTTNPGHVVGSLHYLAPERAAGRPADPSSDLYSIGVLLYQMLTGRLPFEGETPVAVAARQAAGSADPPSRVRTGVPEWLDRVVLRALAPVPEDRFASAGEMREELRRLSASVHEDATSEMPAARPGTPLAKPISARRQGARLPTRGIYAGLAALLLGALVLLGSVAREPDTSGSGDRDMSAAAPAATSAPAPTVAPTPPPVKDTPAPQAAAPPSGSGSQGGGPPGQANKAPKGNGHKKQ